MPAIHDQTSISHLNGFVIRNYGRIEAQKQTTGFGFQINAYNPRPYPGLLFALRATNRENSVQFGVSVNLESGEIWDIGNDTGMIGMLEKDSWPWASPDAPLILRWEIEHAGYALIPRLKVGDEEWLYPSIRFPGTSSYLALAGHNLKDVELGDVFTRGHVWCRDQIV